MSWVYFIHVDNGPFSFAVFDLAVAIDTPVDVEIRKLINTPPVT